MRNFQKLASGVDIIPLLNAVQRQPELWNTCRLRTTYDYSPHKQVDDILLRFVNQDIPEEQKNVATVLDGHESVNYPAFAKLFPARPIIFDLMRRVEGERLGRVMITRLAPGKCITPHVDSGDHAEYYDRYHVILQNLPGSIFRAGNEIVTMQAGDVWWFENRVEHEVQNNSEDDRITMIVDIRTTR